MVCGDGRISKLKSTCDQSIRRSLPNHTVTVTSVTHCQLTHGRLHLFAHCVRVFLPSGLSMPEFIILTLETFAQHALERPP
jgi:hypothetical protein